LLFFNLDKIHFIQFNNASKCTLVTEIKYEDEQISIAKETKFLGLYINNNLSWKTHIEGINKLSSACYVMRLVKPYVTAKTLKMIYYSSFHFIMTCGLIFWTNSPDSIKIFRLQKKIIRIMMGCRSRDSGRKLFNLEIQPLPSQYILSLLLFMIRNKNQFQVNSEVHQINTRQHANLHQPSVNATKYQKVVHCIGVKVFNFLPFYIKAEVDNPKIFKQCYKNT